MVDVDTDRKRAKLRFRERLSSFKQTFRRSVSSDARLNNSAPSAEEGHNLLASKPDSSPKHASSHNLSTPSLALLEASDRSTVAGAADPIQTDGSTVGAVKKPSASLRSASADPQTNVTDTSGALVTQDIWSAAYREAVDSLGKDINVAILRGRSVAQLFEQLEEIDKEATEESVFLRGVKYLHSLQVPLEKFKLALDLATPLTNIEPTAATVFGILRSVTAIAISISIADLEFAKQIGEMLEQLTYIDDCDTLGQKADKGNIHKALVLVYRKLLEFYNVAFEILTRKGVKLVTKMIILENDRLPNIIKDFLECTENLKKFVQNATLDIVQDIRTMLYEDKSMISRWLGHEKIIRRDHYHAHLQGLRADRACDFLLTDTKFTNWCNTAGPQQMIILGEIGYGKSVSLAFLIDELQRLSQHQIPQPKICYHYCLSGETGQVIYIFSTLILSLLEQLSGLKKTFCEWYEQAKSLENLEPAANPKALEQFLQNTLESLDRPLFIIIDGLDECDRVSRNSLLKSLKGFQQKNTRLKILLSSRPDEHTLRHLDESIRIDLDSDAERDRIITEKTVEMQLGHLEKDCRLLIIEKISTLAQGCALWTKLVVELIEIQGISALSPMQTFLNNVPQPWDLSKLYADLFSRYTSDDPGNRMLAATALEILAVSKRPLSILELAWAVALAAADEKVTTVVAIAGLVDHKRIMGLIVPFIGYVDFKDERKHQIRLLHQSTRHFIIAEWTSNGPPPRATIAKASANAEGILERTQNLEKAILRICIRYLLLDDVGQIELFSAEQKAIIELPQEFDLFRDADEPNDYTSRCTWEEWEQNMIRYDPTDRGFGELFVYASCYWPEHFGAVASEPLPVLEDIERLCRAGSTRLHNWILQYCRPACTIQGRIDFDSTLYDPLSITALFGSDLMLLEMVKMSDFNHHNFLPRTAVGALDKILREGKLPRLRILFQGPIIGCQLRSLESFQTIMKYWSFSDKRSQDWNTIFDLVSEVSDTMTKNRWGNELFCTAARRGCMPLIQRLMFNAQYNAELRTELLCASQRGSCHQSIGEAVLGNHVDVVEFLLNQQGIEPHLQYHNVSGENVLHLASRVSNPAIVQLLLPHFSGPISQIGSQRETPLMRIGNSPAPLQDRYDEI